jgi:hypothetical protein
MQRPLIVSVVATLLVSAAVAATARGAQAGRAQHGSQIIVVRETATFTSRIDNAPSGPSAGDAFTFTGTLAGRQNGSEQGACTFVTAAVTQCSITAFLPTGQVVFEGQLPFDQTHFQVPIVGGTGQFARARGFADVQVTNATGTIDDVTMHILD